MPTRVYQYGIGRMPLRIPDAAFEQAIKSHRFYNELVALDKQFSERWQAIVAASDADMAIATERIVQLEQELADALAVVAKSRSKHGGKCDVALAATVKAIRAELKEARATAKGRKTEARATAKPRLDELETERKEAMTSARQAAAATGLYWGNYNAVVDRFQTARKNMLSNRSKGQSCDLRFARWDGTTSWTVQLQGGASFADIMGGRCQLVQIDPVPDAAWVSPSRGERRRLCRTTGRIRIGSEGAAPVWMEFPVTIHRPVPADGCIKMAHVVRKKAGLRWEWYLNLVVTSELPEQSGGCPVAVHFGFRREGEVIRVATVHDGRTFTSVTIPYSTVRAMERTEGLRAVLDKHINELRDELTHWLKANAAWLPDWIGEQTRGLHQWRSSSRFVRLLDIWERFTGDEDIYARLDDFRRRHRHLYQWESDLKRKITLRRREAFRKVAAQIAVMASVVYLDDTDYARLARRPAQEDSRANEVEAAVRRMARVAAPAELRAEIERCCALKNVRTSRIAPADITRECCRCGNVAESGELGVGVRVTCPTCGIEHDRDNNAVSNVWSRGERNLSQQEA